MGCAFQSPLKNDDTRQQNRRKNLAEPRPRERKATMTITIPVVVLSLTLGACVLTGCGSSKSKPSQSTLAVQTKLSDSYATSALLALKAIQRDPYVPAKGSQLVSRFTQEKIDAADVAAISDEEKNVTVALNSVYHAQLNLNQFKEKFDNDSHSLERLDGTQYTKTRWDAICDAWGKMMAAESSQLKTLSEPLNVCFSDFDASLRVRSTDVPASCAANQK